MKKGFMAALFYLVFAAFMVSDGLFTSKVGICTDGLYAIQPWSALSQINKDKYNPALDYQAFSIYPWMKHTLDHFNHGKLPLWTNLSGGGAPFIGNLSSAVFFPLNLLGLVVPQSLFWSLTGLIKLWLSAFLTYCLLKKFNLCCFSAFIGGMAFGFSGFQVCWLMHPNSSTAMFLPALFLAAEYFIKRRHGLSILTNAMLIAMMILAGSPEVSFLLMLAWGLYLIYRIRQESEFTSYEGMHLLFFSGLAGLLGIGMAAFQIWPFFEYLNNSYGLELRINAVDNYLNGGPARLMSLFGLLLGLIFPVLLASAVGLLQRKNTIFIALWSGILGGLCLIVSMRIAFWLGARPHFLMQILPELYGAPAECNTLEEVSFSSLNGGYVGVIIAFLGIYTFVAPCKRRPLPFFLVMLLCSFGAAHSIPWLVHLVKALPILGWVNNSCILCLTAFSLAIIAPFGLEDLIFRAAKIYVGRSAAIAGVLTALLLVSLVILDSGWTFFQTGFPLFEEEKAKDPKIIITYPKNGTLLTAPDQSQICGVAKGDIDLVSAKIDDVDLSVIRTEDRLKTEKAEHPGFPKKFVFNYSLDTVDEGSYRVSVARYDESRKRTDETWVNIRVAQSKRITPKDMLVLCLSAITALLLISRAIPPLVRASILLVVLGFDLSLFGYNYNKASPMEELYPPTDVTSFLQQQEKPFRIFAEGGVLHPNSQLPYGIEHMEWDDRLGIDGYCKVCNHIKFDHLARPSQLKVNNFDIKERLFDFLGVRYLLVHKDSESEYLLNQEDKFKKVFTGSVLVYENTLALDRAFILNKWVYIQDHPMEHIVTLDPCEYAMLVEKPLIKSNAQGSGSVAVVEYDEEYVRLHAETKGLVFLVLTDNYFPGWEVYVDEKKVPMYRTTGSFRAVPIWDDGSHKVEFKYRPVSFYGGVYIALACFVICVLLILRPKLTQPMRWKTEEMPEYLIQD